MADQQPTSSDGGASPSDPIDRIERFLAAQDGDGNGQPTEADSSDEGDEAQNAATPDTPEKDAPAKDSEPQLTTSQLAALLDIDEADIVLDDDGRPQFKTKIDGKEGAAKFQDFRKTHQLQGHAENRVRAAEQAAQARMQEAEQQIQQRYAQQQQEMQTLGQINAALQQELKGEFDAINWDAIWAADPAQARALERRFSDRQARINNVAATIQQRTAQASQQAMQQAEQNQRQALAQEMQRIPEMIPEWQDEDTARKEARDVMGWAAKQGYSQAEIANLRAHQIVTLRRAWQHETLQKSKPDVENKVRTAPKLSKPGTPPQNEGNTVELRSLKQQVKQTGVHGQKALEAYLMKAGKA